jgi:predicted aspartyl protease
VAHAGAACEPAKLLATIETLPEATGVPIIPVSISGKRSLMIVDTGAFWSFLKPGVVRELGLTQMQARYTAFTGGGQSTDKYVRIPEFTFGRMLSRDQLFMVDVGNPNAAIGENDLAGIVGADILTRHDVDFDFPGRSFALFDQNHCAGQVLHWQPQSHAVVPFRLVDQLSIVFPILINGRRVSARLDTGVPDTTIYERAARRAFDFKPDAPNVRQVGVINGLRGDRPIFEATVNKIEIGSVTITSTPVQVIPDLVTRASERSQVGSLIPVSDVELTDVLLGLSTLRNLHMYIAYKERKLYISQATGGPPAPTVPTVR